MKARALPRMSVSMTLEAVRARRKDVTRRNENSWVNLKAGDHLLLIEKGQGLKKGERQVVVTEVVVTDVRVEPLHFVGRAGEVAREGVPGLTGDHDEDADLFMAFWLKGHGYKPTVANAMTTNCRRIEWRYLDA